MCGAVNLTILIDRRQYVKDLDIYIITLYTVAKKEQLKDIYLFYTF